MSLTPVTLTQSAAAKARDLLDRESGGESLFLRIAVQPGGCSGLRYQLYFDHRHLDDDTEIVVGLSDGRAITLAVDRMSVPYLTGATIDFVDSINKQGFTIDNPNAAGSCACGDSFH